MNLPIASGALLTGLLLIAGTAQAERMGTHGMLIFGGEGLYASHLPMFHAPHDAQALLDLDSPDPACKPRAPDGLFTIEPERFDLDRLAPDAAKPLREFKATLYSGHFERGGEALKKNCRYRIRSVLHFAWLDPVAADGDVNSFLVIGSGAERYLVHPIGGKPDLDRVLRWTGFSKPPATPRVNLFDAWRDGQVVEVYQETGDLQ